MIILPPFWKTLWFKTLIILSLMVLFSILYQSRIKRIKKKIKFEVEVNNICSKNNLSKTEKEILFQILKGKTNLEIEEILFLSSGSIRNSNSRIYKKLKVKNRMTLIKMFKDLE